MSVTTSAPRLGQKTRTFCDSARLRHRAHGREHASRALRRRDATLPRACRSYSATDGDFVTHDAPLARWCFALSDVRAPSLSPSGDRPGGHFHGVFPSLHEHVRRSEYAHDFVLDSCEHIPPSTWISVQQATSEVTAARRANNRERNRAHTQIVADARGKSVRLGSLPRRVRRP